MSEYGGALTRGLTKALAEKVAREAVEAENNWLDDVLAGLLINGVRKDEIEVQHYPHLRKYAVLVRGVLKYEHRIVLAC